MPQSPGYDLPDSWPRIVLKALARPGAPYRELPPRLIAVDVEGQRLALIEDGCLALVVSISTASAGIGGESGSHKTPPGWHRVHARIGAGAPAGAVFESREPTGRVWAGEQDDEDLILTRVLTLEGLEPGVNQGAGRDSLERYIYLHGTNHEDQLGRPASHGCVRLSNADIVTVFDRVQVGDPVVVVEGVRSRAESERVAAAMPDLRTGGRFHYAGLGGSGMSALAQFQAMLGGRASGSDRAFDRGERPEARALLERLGIRIFPQDGSGLGGDCAALVVSTAVESQVPDVAAARERELPVLHRSELLAHLVESYRTVAIAGTSGKSTVVAMVFEILRGAARNPSVITGGDLRALQDEGLWGNAWYGGSNLLVVEADESDGSVVRYHPAIGVVLNLQRDHKEPAEVVRMFERFREQSRERFVVSDEPNLAGLADAAEVFGLGSHATLRGTRVELEPGGSRFEANGVAFRLQVPGEHNVMNALGAIAACRAVGLELDEMVTPLASFRGVGRRFESLGTARGVEVVDDFAHNAAKIQAALETAKRRGRRVLAVYQPHGYGPTRFLWKDFVDTFAQSMRPQDRLWMLEVFYAGGTAQRDFSSADIIADIAARGATAEFAPSREELRRRILAEAREGDLVVIMGARDPSLTALARDVLAELSAASPHAPRDAVAREGA